MKTSLILSPLIQIQRLKRFVFEIQPRLPALEATYWIVVTTNWESLKTMTTIKIMTFLAGQVIIVQCVQMNKPTEQSPLHIVLPPHRLCQMDGEEALKVVSFIRRRKKRTEITMISVILLPPNTFSHYRPRRWGL